MKSKSTIVFLSLALLLLAVASCRKDPPPAPATTPTGIAAAVKQGTSLLVHVDLQALDLDTMFEKLETRTLALIEKTEAAIQEPETVKKDIREGMGTARKETAYFLLQLADVGVTEFYVTSIKELADVYPALLLIPGNPELPGEVKQFLANMQAFPGGTIGGMSVYPFSNANPVNIEATKADFLARFHALSSGSISEFEAALERQAGAPIRFAFVPPAELREEALAGLPSLMEDVPTLDEKTLRSIIMETRSVSLGVTPAELRLHLVAQTPSEEFAVNARKFAEESIDKMNALLPPEMRLGMMMMRPILMDVLPKPEGDLLVATIDEPLIDKYQPIIWSVMMPAIQAARAAARRVAEESAH